MFNRPSAAASRDVLLESCTYRGCGGPLARSGSPEGEGGQSRVGSAGVGVPARRHCVAFGLYAGILVCYFRLKKKKSQGFARVSKPRRETKKIVSQNLCLRLTSLLETLCFKRQRRLNLFQMKGCLNSSEHPEVSEKIWSWREMSWSNARKFCSRKYSLEEILVKTQDHIVKAVVIFVIIMVIMDSARAPCSPPQKHCHSCFELWPCDT